MRDTVSPESIGGAERWLHSVNRALLPIVSGAAALVLIYELVQLVFLSVPNARLAEMTRSPAAQRSAAFNSSDLANSHLFGEPRVEPIVVTPEELAQDAPDTPLGLTLTGTLSGADVFGGQAIIMSGRGAGQVYQVGQAIGDTGATLYSVQADRVVLRRGGQLEALRFPDPAPSISVDTVTAAFRQVVPEAPVDPATVASWTAQEPDIVRISPHTAAGHFVGFRVNPGEERDAFRALGLEAGDVVTEIDGSALDDGRRAGQFLDALRRTGAAQVRVLRRGEPMNLTIEPQRAAARIGSRSR